jgi:class 3 adenylate cyclase
LSVSTSISFDSLKTEVDKYASIYDWNSATQVLENFIKINRDSDKGAFELLGDCYYNLAFQQNNRDDFKKVVLRAKEAYEKVVDNNKCKARASFCKYWSSDSPDERREIIINECLAPARELASQLENISSKGDESTLVSAYVELLEYLRFSCDISSDRKQLAELVKEAKNTGRKAFLRFKDSSNPETVISIVNSYARFLDWAIGVFIGSDSEEINQIQNDLTPFIDILVKLSAQVEDSRLKSLAYDASGIIAGEVTKGEVKGDYDYEGASSLCEKAIKESEKTGDKYLVGRELFFLSFSLHWISTSKDIIEERREFKKKTADLCSRAAERLKVPLAGYELGHSYFFFVISQVQLSRDSANASEKLRYLDKAIEVAREGLQYSGFSSLYSAESSMGKALTFRAPLVSKKDERVKLLSEAVDLTRNGLSRLVALAEPDSWNVGLGYDDLARAKARLADEKTDSGEEEEQARVSLLKDSVADFKKSIQIKFKGRHGVSSSGRSQIIGQSCEELGDAQEKLYNLSKRKEDCMEAIKAYDESSNYYSQANMLGYVAPITWKTAKLYDSIQEYAKSSNAFANASQQYQSAAANQKGLQKTFTELSQYMQAWSKIEESRQSHADEDYLNSSERLKEAASLLARTESFQYLSKHYEAYSSMEQAEDYSRKEKNQEAFESFGLASDLYLQAEQDATKHGKEADNINWATISKNRGNYCLARKAMEDAKILDRNAQPEASMRKYRTALDTLSEIIVEARKQGGEVGDVEALALSCEALATMKEPEYRSSPELYAKASELFMRARDNAEVKQSFVLSCLANSSICEAFEAGTKFKKSSDVSLYSEIKTKLGVASRYYEEAGFEIASDWTRATEALFDALAYLAGAERELDSTKKTQMYHLAEKHLELSARRYGDIGYEKKRTEVLKHLKTARENRELLITPMEALSQSPTVTSTPVSFTRDQAVGLERFEVANLTGNISFSTNQTNVSSPVRIDIDIANVGKTPALLMKLDNLAPSHGFEIDLKENNNGSQNFLVDGNSIALDLKGKRLEYLKSHQVTIHLIAKNRGNYQFKPRILFVDELGKYRSYEFEPQNVQVTSIERKLAAIMFTDMAGYTALGQRNESLSIALVNEQRKLLRPIFKRHNGREVKTIGDAFLVEFASSLDATRCAYDIQRATREFNISLPEDKRIVLRVGVHIGDVVESEDGDITGDAVNVASRIEPLAEHGGVCLTRQVYDNIQNKFDLKLQSLGLKSLKNVSSEIEVFKMVMPWD